MPKPRRIYPGRRSRDEWRALPHPQRHDLARRAVCDLLGSFRHCTNKRCRRARSCCGVPDICLERLWRGTKKRPKTLRRGMARLAQLADL